MVVLNVLGCWSFITPKMLGLLFKAFYSMISMCAEDSSSLALVSAHAAPIHSEPAVALPLDGQDCTFGLTYHQASRVDYTIFPHLHDR